MRHMPRFRNGSDVDKMTDAMRVEECNELLASVGGMADGEENGLRHTQSNAANMTGVARS